MQKRIFTLFAMSLLLAATFALQAQTTHTFGDYDADGTGPINVGYNYSASQMIFTPEQVGLVGNIERIIFNNTGGGGYDRSIRVYIGTTSKTHFTGVDDWIDPSDLTCIYYGEERISSYSFNVYPDIPFYYDGTSNLVIFIYDQTGTYQSGNSRAYFETDIDDSRDYVALKYSSDTYPISFPSPNANFCEITKELPVVDFYINNDPIPTTVTSNLPASTSWNSSISQQIFTPEEVNGIGNIDSVVIHGLSSAVTSRNNVEIYLCHTDQIDFNGNPRQGSTWFQADSMTRVFSGTINFTGAPDLTIHFDTTFEYDGHSNLVFAVRDKSGSGDVSVQTTCNVVSTYRCIYAAAIYFSVSFAYPDNSERIYAKPYVNSIQFFEPNCGIAVDGNVIADRYADNFTQGLESGNIVYEADTKTLTLNNITLVNQDDPEINCSKHMGDLTIVSNGFNSNSRGKFIAAPGYKTTFQGDIFNLGCIEVSDSGSEVVFDNTTMIINVNDDGLNYGLHGCGNETLTINNSDVKVYGNISAVDGFAGINLNDCEITRPAGAVVDGGRITLNGSAVSDTVIIIPTKGTGLENITSTTFSIFPNPAEYEVTLHLEHFEGTAYMSIYSADGRIMNVAELPAIDSDYRMDVSSLPAGIYNITVTSNSLRQTATLIKK